MELKTEKHHIAAGIGLLILIGFAATNAVGQITTQETGPDAINITTDPVTNVKETEATFQATLDGFDNTNYDAALIYWNYSTDSSYDQPGPMTVENTETQRSVFHPDLAPDTSYNVEAYAEPIVWDDPTLMENYAEVYARSSNIGEFSSELKPDLSQTYTETSNSSTTEAQGLAFSSDGTKMFVSNFNGEVQGYSLDSSYDVGTATEKSAWNKDAANAMGLEFSPDGTKMFVLSRNGVRGYSLDSPYDVSTASEFSSFSVPYGSGLAFSPDGSKMYISNDDCCVGENEMRSYDLGTEWNVSTASESFTKDMPDGLGGGLAFSPDGSKMFVSNPYEGIVQGYNLSSPWDLDTAEEASSISTSYGDGLAFSLDGSKVFVSYADNQDSVVQGYER